MLSTGEYVSIIEKAVSKLDQTKAEGAAKAARDAGAQLQGHQAEPIVQSAIAGDSATPDTTPIIAAAPVVEGAAIKPATTPSVPVPEIAPATMPPQDTTHRAATKRVEIDLKRLSALNMVTSDGERNPVAEEFRAIKRPLIDNAFSQNGRPVSRNNLIMVTSALPGEGKTFSAINLAISIAMELDHTVLLVDADVARPSVLRTLGLRSEAGLMDVLLDGRLDVSDVLLKTNIDTLSILPAGKNHRHATELLASQTMSKLLDEIASRYPDRIVIFDSPPLLLTSEARVLASQMGQIVVVVEAETTTMHAVKSALSQLEACSNVNLVYNKARSFPGQENYGYYYN